MSYNPDQPQQQQFPQQPGQYPSTPPKTSFWRRKVGRVPMWLLLIIAISLCGLGGIITAAVGRSSSTMSSTQPTTQPTNAPATVVATHAAAKPTPTPKPTGIQVIRQHVAGCSGGVTKNFDGTYHFSWLHVAGGKVVDQNNCPVTLLGLNTAGFEFGDASGGDMTQSHIQQLSSRFNVDLWRLAINVSWWNNNKVVPSVNMHYQDWIKQQIQWMKQDGNYVEIDPTNYVTISPKYGVQYCSNESVNPPPDPNCIPAQNTLNNPPWTEHQMVDATVQFWNTVVPLYANDPAILYDALNEPYPSNNPNNPWFNNYHQDLSQMIDTIQSLNPKALVFVYAEGTGALVNGTARDYTQQNLVFDYHIYDDPTWTWQQKLQDFQPQFTWLQAHNHAVTIGEWGDNNLGRKKAFADAILNLVKTQGFATSYYNEGNMMNNGQLTDQGNVVQKDYASLPSVTGASTP